MEGLANCVGSACRNPLCLGRFPPNLQAFKWSLVRVGCLVQASEKIVLEG